MTPEEQKAQEQEAEARRAEEEAEKARQDESLKKELDKVQKAKLGKRERLEFAKKKIEEQLKNDFGGEYTPDEDDDTPVTKGELKKLEQEKAKKTALQIAESIEDETERELTKHYLENRIVPSEDPEDDVKLARVAVNAVKNAQIAEELARKGSGKAHASAPGAPAMQSGGVFEPTPEELVFMNPPYSLSKEMIIANRKKNE